ncbi:MAG: radical SAM protein, partial [Desulfurococcales archaeon]|nr:radical SAM protein [Desulfurococcales archaeon]
MAGIQEGSAHQDKHSDLLRPVSKFEGKAIIVDGKPINIGGPLPSLKEGEKLVKYTQSICPICERLLPAIIVEREGKLFIRKECPEHGHVN